MKLLLHCCCAPCSVSCVNSLFDEKITPVLFWYNPNIHPYTEYKSRRDCFINFGESRKIKTNLADEYGIKTFLGEVSSGTEKRCNNCYRLRLEKTALFAVNEGFEAFTTTLLISPHQDHDAINCIAQETALKYGIEFYYRDFRPLFRESQNIGRSSGMYIQKYCGCIFSEEERYSKSILNTQSKSNIQSILNTQSITNSQLNLQEKIFDRVALITGKNGLERLSQTNVLIFGAGGVGSWAAEALVRSGIGKISIIDNDKICESNINRQIEATAFTLGQPKASVLKKRLLEINPECQITAFDILFCKENSGLFGIEKADYVIDAIDTLNHKLDLIEIVCNTKAVLFSSMGMALRTDPSKVKITSIWKTDKCSLARLVRHGLRKRGFKGDINVVFSDEQPAKNVKANLKEPGFQEPEKEMDYPRRANGSIVTVTGTAGFLLASLVFNDVIAKSKLLDAITENNSNENAKNSDCNTQNEGCRQ